VFRRAARKGVTQRKALRLFHLRILMNRSHECGGRASLMRIKWPAIVRFAHLEGVNWTKIWPGFRKTAP
jgi:hypothetical protein